VQGIVAAFMPGQEYGNAVVDLLWGEVEPSARLPITLPAEENQIGLTEQQWPGVDLDTHPHSTYSEKLEVGYRYYDAHKLEPAFAFGFGLGYTSFNYSGLSVSDSAVSFTLWNVGKRQGVAVPQLYLGFPKSAGEPPSQLKGFQPVTLKAGEAKKVTLPLTQRMFSIWDVSKHGWAVQSGEFTVMVGASSRDVRLTASLRLGGEVQPLAEGQ